MIKDLLKSKFVKMSHTDSTPAKLFCMVVLVLNETDSPCARTCLSWVNWYTDFPLASQITILYRGGRTLIHGVRCVMGNSSVKGSASQNRDAAADEEILVTFTIKVHK